MVEGYKGGCNVVPWQELGGVRCDRKLLKMSERLCLSLRGNHTHDIEPLVHEQVVVPNSPKPKVPEQQQQPMGVVPPQFQQGPYRPPIMVSICLPLRRMPSQSELRSCVNIVPEWTICNVVLDI